jgi:transcriptional regulator with XRE-family HTH domain
MSQEKLGEALSVTFQQVQKYEKGTNRISASRLQQIANVLGVRIHYFYDSADEDGSEAAGDPFALVMDHASAELLQAFKAVQDPAMRRAILGIARAAAGRPTTEPA